jgi:hypothetical protein
MQLDTPSSTPCLRALTQRSGQCMCAGPLQSACQGEMHPVQDVNEEG